MTDKKIELEAAAYGRAYAAGLAALEAKKIIQRGRDLILMLIKEIEGLSKPSVLALIKREVKRETAGENGHRRKLMLRAVSAPVRADAAKNLTEALASLVCDEMCRKCRAKEKRAGRKKTRAH